MGTRVKRGMLLGAAIALSFCALTAFAAPSSEGEERNLNAPPPVDVFSGCQQLADLYHRHE